ncbi:ribosome biogenesis factor YjgA [Nitrosovibrio tenuis]|uniref:Dual-action ribosomal maturation protein DarP n=1 Tax=Nitrosovibrio tenuis TaxID=1233 RepID=A0A1H7GHG9_9PROT|nr:ribosome biogenesis factor YjgA [Nitrosovibrio tenuis]SEK35265.1 ribosome-associated protein [Nitrosovibrio tenuis]
MQKRPEHDLEQFPPSKTRRKHEMHALQDMGEQLVQLDLKRLSEFNLPETLADAILEARRIRAHGARRRQMQLIGKLMRDIDAAPIREKLDMLNRVTLQHAAWLHLLERWRDRLLADEQALTELGQTYPAIDLQRLRTLMRNAQREKLANKPPRSFRALFHELQRIIPETVGTGVLAENDRGKDE